MSAGVAHTCVCVCVCVCACVCARTTCSPRPDALRGFVLMCPERSLALSPRASPSPVSSPAPCAHTLPASGGWFPATRAAARIPACQRLRKTGGGPGGRVLALLTKDRPEEAPGAKKLSPAPSCPSPAGRVTLHLTSPPSPPPPCPYHPSINPPHPSHPPSSLLHPLTLPSPPSRLLTPSLLPLPKEGAGHSGFPVCAQIPPPFSPPPCSLVPSPPCPGSQQAGCQAL